MSEGTDAALFPWEQEETEQGAAHAESPPQDATRPESPPQDAAGAGPTSHEAVHAEPDTAANDAHSEAEQAEPAARRERPLVRKEYYAISEVADLVGLPAHVLRYWESQFAVLNPSKNRSGNRVYQRKEIRLILLVKQLLYEEKYTVEGAKQRLDQLRRGGAVAHATAQALDTQLVQVLRDELRTLSELLAPDTQ